MAAGMGVEPGFRAGFGNGHPAVVVKRGKAVTWYKSATDHAAKQGGKPWMYLLIPHDAIAENMGHNGLAGQFICK